MSLPMIGPQPKVPPGFRFHPTDEELVDYYLRKKVDSKKIDLDVIREIDLYKIEPWDLEERCRIGSAEQSDWYFFSHKDKKYPTGTRTNRATAAGFWKATGRDKAIYAKLSSKLIGMRKTLVYYRGRAPNGQKSDWIMHEYRLESCESGCVQTTEEGWAVCRVFRKRCNNTKKESDVDSLFCLQDQIALLPELKSPEIGLYGDITYGHPFTCKQELEIERHPLHDHSMQLPQLETPKLVPIFAFPIFKELLMNNYNGPRDEFQRQFAIGRTKVGEMQAQPTVENALSSSNSVEQKVKDWRILDKLVASQLSQGDTPKELKFSERENDSLGDVAGQQASQEYNPENDIDLWSFAKREMRTGGFQ